MAIATLGFKVDSSGVRRATKDLGALDGAAIGATGAAAKLGKAAGLAAVALAAAFSSAAVINGIANFDREMSKVAAITQATSIELGAMRDVARELGATTEFSAKQAAEGLSFLGMAGFEAAESIAALPAVLDLATAAGLGLGSAADITSNIMSAFSIAARDSADVTDILAAASSSANTDVSQLGQAMKFVGPVAAGLGISMSDTAAAIGKLSDAGIQGGQAGTSLRKIMLSLAAPTKEATDTLTAMGISLSEVDPNVVSLTDIIDRLNEAQIDAAQGSKIFGQEAVSGILALTAQADGLRELTGELKNVDGAAGDMANTMRDNLGGDIDTLMSSVSGLILTMGDAGLTAVLRGVVAGLTGVINGVSLVVSAIGDFAGVIGNVTGYIIGYNEAQREVQFASDIANLAIADELRQVNALGIALKGGITMSRQTANVKLIQAEASLAAADGMRQEHIESVKQGQAYKDLATDIENLNLEKQEQIEATNDLENSSFEGGASAAGFYALEIENIAAELRDAVAEQEALIATAGKGTVEWTSAKEAVEVLRGALQATEGDVIVVGGEIQDAADTAESLARIAGGINFDGAILSATELAQKLGISLSIAARIQGMSAESRAGVSGPDGAIASLQNEGRLGGGPLQNVVSTMSLGPSTRSGGGSRGGSGGGGGGGQSAAQKQRDNDLRDAEKILDGLKTTQDEYNDAVSEANRLYEAGVLPMAAWDAQLTSLEAGMADSKFGELRDDVDGFTASLFDGIDGIKSFAQTMIQEFAMLQASNAIKGFLGIGGGGATSGIIGSFLTGAFADGTNNAPGGPALVGERGPEIVNLKKGDTVTPNHALGGAMDVRVSVDNNGNLMAFVRDQAGKLISQSTPAIVSQSVSASARASQSTKSLFINAS